MRNILRKSLFIVLTLCNIQANATDIVWDFKNLAAKNFSNNASYSFTATDGTTEMRYTAGSSDAIVAKSGNKDGYLKENGKTGGASAKDVDGTTAISKNRLIRLFVTGSGTLTISCTDNIGVYKICDGSASGTVLANSYTANTTSAELTVTGSLIWIETTTKGYINTITWSPSGSTTPTVSSITVSPTSKTLDINDTQQLTATVNATPASADKSVTWSTSDANVATVSPTGLVTAVGQGTATITAASNLDNTKSATCTITVNAPAAPIPVAAISLPATATVGIGATTTLTVSYTPADANTGKVVTWSSANENTATVDASGVVTGVAAGTVAITATSTTNASITASCNVTVQAIAVTGVSLDKVSTTLQVGAKETLTAIITPSNASNQNVTWESSMPSVATVNNGQITAVSAGSTNITVTTQDGNHQASCAVTVSAAPPVPSTSLTIHEPEIYEEKEIAGGYGGTLSVFNDREYEVYYMTRDENSKFCVATTNADKTRGITTIGSGDYDCTATDGWFKFASGKGWSSASDAMGAEFGTMSRRLDLNNTSEFTLHVKGFDQFSIVAKDKKIDDTSGQTKPENNRYLEVYINGELQDIDSLFNTNPSIRRYDLPSAGEYVIRIIHHGSENSSIYAFSLRVSQQPRTKYLKGNDSTQVVYQTQAIKPVVYTTKYNNIDGAETRLEWTGTAATGISLSKIVGDISDTLTLTGTANCPVGTYNYAVVAYYNNVEINRVTGTFYVKSDIKAASDINVTVFNNEAMDQIKFKYYALDASAVQLTWGANGQPSGVSGSGANGIYTISGTPTITGTLPKDFPYSITVAGADTVIQGKITIKELVHTDRDVLFLYKNTDAYNTPIYNYLKTQGWNPIERTAADDVRHANQYGYYKWILISEDVDANTPEVIKIIQGEVNLPVLNLKGFTYAAGAGRLGWGEPDNGAIDTMDVKTKGTKIYIQNINHPIFKSNASFSGKHVGDSIAILSNYTRRGVMPIAIDLPGSLCLATGYTRNIDDYYAYGELQTSIHEVLPNSEARNNSPQKYICMPIGGQATLSNDGKSLLNSIITYLLDNTPVSITRPVLELQSFVIKHNTGDVIGAIDQTENTITLNMTIDQYREMDSLRSVTPQVTLADPTATRVIPSENVDLRFAQFMAKEFVVTDFINRRVYNLKIRFPQGIENVEYEEGQWVNIFDMYGRKVATTNESIYTIDLPRGIYIIVTENGNTIKLSR